MVERTTISFPYEPLAPIEHPAFEARGTKDGPRLSLIGGIHGCEYSSIAAVIRFMNELETSELAGTVTAVPVVSMESFRRRSPFVIPVDGKNLNRYFPGDPDGTYTDVLAHAIFERLIEPADVVLDLHGGDLVEALEPFSIYVESEVEEQARGLAVAFGLPYVVREADGGGLEHMTVGAAARAGVPAIIAEAGGIGQLDQDAVSMLVDGVRNVFKHLGMLPGDPSPPRRPLRSVGRSVWLNCAHQGWWESAVRPGDDVAAGQLLGRVKNLWGDVLEEIAAPEDCVVLFVTTSAAVEADGLVLGLGAELAAIAS